MRRFSLAINRTTALDSLADTSNALCALQYALRVSLYFCSLDPLPSMPMIADPNALVDIELERLSPAEADLRIRSSGGATRLVGGRLLGPTCPYATTVQVAYPVRLLSPGEGRVVVPEPNYWDPRTPLIYHLLLRLEVEGAKQQLAHRVGFFEASLGSAGLTWNGKPTSLQAARMTEINTLEELSHLWEQQFDTVIIPARSLEPRLLEWADTYGMWLLVEVADSHEMDRFGRFSLTPGFLGFALGIERHWQTEVATPRKSLVVAFGNRELATTGCSELRLVKPETGLGSISVGKVSNFAQH